MKMVIVETENIHLNKQAGKMAYIEPINFTKALKDSSLQ